MEDREALDQYEKAIKKENQQQYFKRVVLAAEIANHLHDEPTFGRVKFQKLVYLCEHAAKMDLNDRYTKQVAGPFDNKFMHTIEEEFKKNKWFEVKKIKEGKMTRSVYEQMSGAIGYKKYYQSYFSKEAEAIDYIINLFRKTKTDKTEVAATLYACYVELKEPALTASFDQLLIKFYAWAKSKQRFEPELVESTWRWMIEKGIVK
jgi:hypothetical protein